MVSKETHSDGSDLTRQRECQEITADGHGEATQAGMK
jgi:hypothetical protein